MNLFYLQNQERSVDNRCEAIAEKDTSSVADKETAEADNRAEEAAHDDAGGTAAASGNAADKGGEGDREARAAGLAGSKDRSEDRHAFAKSPQTAESSQVGVLRVVLQ